MLCIAQLFTQLVENGLQFGNDIRQCPTFFRKSSNFIDFVNQKRSRFNQLEITSITVVLSSFLVYLVFSLKRRFPLPSWFLKFSYFRTLFRQDDPLDFHHRLGEMKLHTTQVDFTVKKVLAAAAFVGVKVEIVLCSASALGELSADAKTMCLEDDAGSKTANNIPILKAKFYD